jgi:hypothetical protein
MDITFRQLQRMTVKDLVKACPCNVTVNNLPAFKITTDIIKSYSEAINLIRDSQPITPTVTTVTDSQEETEHIPHFKTMPLCQSPTGKCFNPTVGKFLVTNEDSELGENSFEVYLCQKHLDLTRKERGTNVEELSDTED